MMANDSESSWEIAATAEASQQFQGWCKEMLDQTSDDSSNEDMFRGLADLLMTVVQESDLDRMGMFTISHVAFVMCAIADEPDFSPRQLMTEVLERVTEKSKTKPQ